MSINTQVVGAVTLFFFCWGTEKHSPLLLNNWASVLLTTNGTSPLYVACQNGHAKIVQLLINQGGEVNTYANDRGCPLFVARLNNHKSIVQILLHNGARSTVNTNNAVSPSK